MVSRPMTIPMTSSGEAGAQRDIVLHLMEHGTVEFKGTTLQVSLPVGNAAVDASLQGVPGAVLSSERWVMEGVSALDWVGQFFEDAVLAPTMNAWIGAQAYHACCRGVLALDSLGARIQVQKIEPNAVIPYKARVSDSGYDLTLIAERKKMGSVRLLGTGLIVQPPDGYYFDVVARSSIIKTGHMIANNVGVIDRAYRGELMVPVIKVDPNAPELELPIRLAQLIPRPIAHFSVEVVSNLTYTARGSGGFGSTG